MNNKLLMLAFISCLLMACSTEIIDTEENSVASTHMLKVKTSSASDDIRYPLQVYAYDSKGKKVKDVEIASPSDEISMELSTGTYTVAAVSGSTSFTSGYADEPLMLAQSEVTIENADVNAELTMMYAVAQLSVALSRVPDDVENVTVTVGSLYAKVSALGEYSGNKDATLECAFDAEDGLWKTDTVYVLPSVGNAVSFTIKEYASGNLVKEFTYQYTGALQAGTPYHFSGSYDSGIVNAKVTFTLTQSEWGDAVNTNFAFGEGVESGDGGSNDGTVTPSDASVFYVDNIPSACSGWNGHVVASVDEEGNALLFSLKEWGPLSSISEVSSEIESYSEGEISGWNVPTEDQAQVLCDLYKNMGTIKNVQLANLLNSIGADELRYEKPSDKECYLYQDETKEFNFREGNLRKKIATTHYLRLVKPVKFIKN